MNFPELMMIAVGAFFVFVMIFAKFAQSYDNRQTQKKKDRTLPKMP